MEWWGVGAEGTDVGQLAESAVQQTAVVYALWVWTAGAVGLGVWWLLRRVARARREWEAALLALREARELQHHPPNFDVLNRAQVRTQAKTMEVSVVRESEEGELENVEEVDYVVVVAVGPDGKTMRMRTRTIRCEPSDTTTTGTTGTTATTGTFASGSSCNPDISSACYYQE